MQPLYTLGGGGFAILKYQVEDAFSVAGIPAILGIAADGGVQNATTTASIGTLGITLDTAPGSTGALLSIVVNPDLVIRGKLTQGTSADTALTVGTIDVATSNSVFDVTGIVLNSPDLDDGVVWGYSGTNEGNYRAIIAADADTCTVKNVWSPTPVIGDQFLFAARAPGVMSGVALTTDLTQVDASNDNDSSPATTAVGDSYAVVGGEFKGASDDGRNNSFLHLVAQNHAF